MPLSLCTPFPDRRTFSLKELFCVLSQLGKLNPALYLLWDSGEEVYRFGIFVLYSRFVGEGFKASLEELVRLITGTFLPATGT